MKAPGGSNALFWPASTFLGSAQPPDTAVCSWSGHWSSGEVQATGPQQVRLFWEQLKDLLALAVNTIRGPSASTSIAF